MCTHLEGKRVGGELSLITEGQGKEALTLAVIGAPATSTRTQRWAMVWLLQTCFLLLQHRDTWPLGSVCAALPEGWSTCHLSANSAITASLPSTHHACKGGPKLPEPRCRALTRLSPQGQTLWSSSHHKWWLLRGTSYLGRPHGPPVITNAGF